MPAELSSGQHSDVREDLRDLEDAIEGLLVAFENKQEKRFEVHSVLVYHVGVSHRPLVKVELRVRR